MISRRVLIAALVASPVMTALPTVARNNIDYTPDIYAQHVASGKPFMLDFAADWCTTCQAQERVLDALQAANPAYQAIPILRVDWDTYRTSELVRDMAIPRRSTLVMMKGDQELGRVVAQTGESTIEDLFKLGV